MPNARRTELEIEALEARKAALDSDLKYKAYQYNQSMPCEEGMADEQIAMLMMYSLEHQRNAVAADIAKKRLELFELQGS